MNILIVDRSGQLPVKKYGGTERVIQGLGKQLHKLGHQVTYLVPEGSTSDYAKILVLNQTEDLNHQIPNDIDIVHMNYNPEQKLNKPYLITMHGNPSIHDSIDNNTVFVSKNQAKRYGSTTYIYNGLDWEDYPLPLLDHTRTYLHFLAKASWKIKNLFGSIKIALKSTHQLHVMGGEKWTSRNIKRGLKYLLNPKIIFHGMVENDKKMDIMHHSKGLIFPVLWHEPFGLAIIESLYAGCAVFGTANGSLPELITPEVGAIGTTSDEIAKAIQEFDYNPKRCHEYAVTRFNSKVMTESYLKLYDNVLAGETLNTHTPKYIPSENTIPNFN